MARSRCIWPCSPSSSCRTTFSYSSIYSCTMKWSFYSFCLSLHIMLETAKLGGPIADYAGWMTDIAPLGRQRLEVSCSRGLSVIPSATPDQIF
ncbi:hypothetical protein BDQ12DRAFT_407392 [Crucibulum laeve]|uniref:Uncharacterized protein n=1 Tax=Crucibulum laeve TaxID=68775 RepID=A0A5C3LMQ4_9AGAR|nr:hypothetical protein BDQ12DRAFT_407392 [Crucibulum laeve]